MDESETVSLRSRRKKAPMRISCCFHGHHNHHHQRSDSMDAATSSSSPLNSPLSRALKGRCKDLMARMGRHRRHSSADLTYDPLSYSRNFQEPDHPELEDFAARSFVSRLPVSPTSYSSRYSCSGNSARAAMLMMTPTSAHGRDQQRWFSDQEMTPTSSKEAGKMNSSSSSMDLLTPSGSYDDQSRRVLVELC